MINECWPEVYVNQPVSNQVESYFVLIVIFLEKMIDLKVQKLLFDTVK